GSAIFNIFRNVGGSFGIAMLSTVITRREQFHDMRIGESVTAFDPETQARVAAISKDFVSKGFDPVTAMQQAYASIQGLVRRDAFIMAFNDAFLIVAIGLLVSAAAIWFCKKARAGQGAAVH
ncbi:MAG: EmrB/QacA family drug resistance transporter, partial [Verrucomicrobiota bacterium]|nr:EmrB/QacA family drug resistance transporter [Verrucomicrobiota bacterium]